MAGYQKASAIAEQTSNRSNGNRIDFADMYVKIPVEKRAGAHNTKIFHMIGVPYGFLEHKAEIRDPANPKGPTQKVDFPDKEFNGSFARICTEGDPAFGECPWCRLGFITTKQWAVNVIDRTDGKIRILKKGSGIFTELGNFEKANAAYNLRKGYGPGHPKALWTELGGEKAPDFVITASYDAAVLGNTAYLISVDPDIVEVEPTEIEALKAIRTMAPAEIAKLRSISEDLARMPDYAFHGYDVAFLHRAQLIRTSKGGQGAGASAPSSTPATPPSDLNINGGDDLPNQFSTPVISTEDTETGALAW